MVFIVNLWGYVVNYKWRFTYFPNFVLLFLIIAFQNPQRGDMMIASQQFRIAFSKS